MRFGSGAGAPKGPEAPRWFLVGKGLFFTSEPGVPAAPTGCARSGPGSSGPNPSYSDLEIRLCWCALQMRNNGAADPHRVLQLGGLHDLNLPGRWCEGREFLAHALADACGHRGAAREHNVAEWVISESTSPFMMDWKVVSWMPLASLPMQLGWKSTTGQRKRSLRQQ